MTNSLQKHVRFIIKIILSDCLQIKQNSIKKVTECQEKFVKIVT